MDVLHLHQVWDYPLYAAARAAEKTNRPYLVTPHGIFGARWRYSSLKKSLYLGLIGNSVPESVCMRPCDRPRRTRGVQKSGDSLSVHSDTERH